MSTTVHSSSDGIHTITLARPEKRNSFNAPLVRELTAALRSAAADSAARAVVLRGEGPAFSAGADLAYLQDISRNSPLGNLEDSQMLASLFTTLHNHPLPTIARVHGPALAGGCGLALACDVVIAAESAILGFPEVRIGFVPAIVARLLVERVGQGRARDLLLTGRTLTAAEAGVLGLVTQVVADDALDAAVSALEEIFRHAASPEAVRCTKRLLVETGGMDFAQATAHAAGFNALARTTGDFRKGIGCFLTREKPEWM